MRPRHAEIAGAGLGGLAAAIALRQQGWSVRVHEQATSLRETGAGLYFSGNGIRVLRALGIDGAVRAGALQPRSIIVRVHGVERSRHAVNAEGGDPMWTMTRQHLHGCVLERARTLGVQIETGSCVAGALPQGVLLLQDGRRLAADLVIGADGVRSSVRASLPFRVRREQFGDGIVRLLAEAAGGDVLQDAQVVDDFSPDDKLPLRVLSTPVAPGLVYLALMADAEAQAATRVPPDTTLWAGRFPALAHLFHHLLGPGRFDRYQATLVDRWSIGRVVLIGDAAHAMPPTLGQGAGFAMMNALALSAFLDRDDDLELALVRWEREERPLTDRTQAKAIAVATLGQRRADLDPLDTVAESARHVPTGAC